MTQKLAAGNLDFMGMDAVDIIMKVEGAFGIAIEDDEAENIQTPGQLIDLIILKTGRTHDGACLTQRGFHRFRAAMMRQLGIPRDNIRPGTSLAMLLPRKVRKQQLRKILDELAMTKPVDFVRPAWLVLTLFSGIFGIGASTSVCLALNRASANLFIGILSFQPVLWGIVSSCLFGWLCAKLTAGMKYEFKPSMATVGGFSRWVAISDPNLVDVKSGKWSREQVAEKVRQIVIDVFDCEKEYNESAKFITLAIWD